MNSREEHMAADEMLLGETLEGVHAFMDNPVTYLGAGHRSVYHTKKTIEYVEFMHNEKADLAGRIALLHILLDNRVLDRDWIEQAIDE
jgi:hypothetical protein